MSLQRISPFTFEKSGYKPFNPDLILQNLPGMALKDDLEQSKRKAMEQSNFNKPISFDPVPVYILLHNSGNAKACPPTPVNGTQVYQLLSYATKEDMVDPIAFKLAKGLKKKFAECAIREKENADIVAGLWEKEKKKVTTRGRYRRGKVVKRGVFTGPRCRICKETS